MQQSPGTKEIVHSPFKPIEKGGAAEHYITTQYEFAEGSATISGNLVKSKTYVNAELQVSASEVCSILYLLCFLTTII